jgi:sortase A
LRGLELALWLGALGALGWCAFVVIERRLYQARQERILQEEIQARAAAKQIPPAPAPAPAPTPREEVAAAEPAWVMPPPAPARGAALGRLEIPRLKLSGIICEGTDDATLRVSIGHIPGTALPSAGGSNVALAGHRDSFFSELGRLHRDDIVRLTTPEGMREYRVEWRGIVAAEDTEVLDPSLSPSLTLVTCYPFHYIGAAPRRYIVRAVSRPDLGG